jgi:site-specific DNA-methyltransferase (adenine-specific)
MKTIERNTLFYGDNLPVMRDHIPDESVDLIYLDPPFNSNRSYNVLFKNESGSKAEAQIQAFDDAWHWGESAEETYAELLEGPSFEVATMIEALREFIGTNQMMAYLVMMTARLDEMRRVLKPTGSIYLHCDPTSSHYLKVILDTIFGADKFQNEIVWKRTSAHNDPGRYGANIDILLFYTRGDRWTWNQIFMPHNEEYIARFKHKDPDGRLWADDNLSAKGLSGGGYEYEYKGVKSLWRCPIETMQRLDAEGKLYFTSKGGIRIKRYLDENKGTVLQCLWDDIFPINSQAQERLGYPTQKPLALLERIIQASSNKGDVVLDPFSGCGTAISAAQKLERRWIGIDITYLAIAMHKNRLKDMYNLEPGKDYDVIGEPTDLSDARELAQEDRYQFQWWALSLVKARPVGSTDTEPKKGKKGSDLGIDGIIPFVEDANGKLKRVLVQVKSGHVKSGDIRDLHGVLEREGAPIGLLITLDQPTADMQKEAVTTGYYFSEAWQQQYPRIQILTIEELLNGAQMKMPPTHGTFKKAERVKKEDAKQGGLGI